MQLMTKLKTFAATLAMGALTHLLTTQTAVIQQKLGFSTTDPQKLGEQLVDKMMKKDLPDMSKVTKQVTNMVKRIPASVPTAHAAASEAVPQKKAEKSELSKLDKKLCLFKESYVSKNQEGIKKNYRSLQDMYFKDKKMTEKEAGVFVAKLEGYLASGKYGEKKVNCPK